MKTMNIMRRIVWVCMLTGVMAGYVHGADRWYTPQQVASGKQLYADNCATCHGADAASTTEWRKRDKDGNYPPPPLNGTAHTWHHSKKLLEKTIREGGIRIGGKMPPFVDKLKPDEIEAVIAWVQSLWPDEIYAAWLDRGGLPSASGASKKTIPSTSDKKIADMFQARPSGLVIGETSPSPVMDIYQSKYGSRFIYVTKDGRYGFFGDLIDLQTGDNLTEGLRQQERLDLLKTIDPKDMVVYPAKGEEKSHITIFTDTSCPYCRKLHAEVPVLNKAGISVRYIAFPRGGKRGQGYKAMRSVWCAKDRRKAMDIAKGIKKGKLGTADCKAADAVDEGYLFGARFGIRGTPASVLPDGRFVSGYRPAKDFLKMLETK